MNTKLLEYQFPRPEFLVLLLTLFLDGLGESFLMPLWGGLFYDPHYSLFASTDSHAFRQMIYGYLVATLALAGALISPVIGVLSDRFGRKKILMLALAMMVLGYFGAAYGVHHRYLIPFIAALTAIALAKNSNIVVQSAIIDLSTPASKALNLRWSGIAFMMGIIIGPLASGFFSTLSLVFLSGFSRYTTPFLFIALIEGINLLLIKFIYQNSSVRDQSSDTLSLKDSLGRFITLFRGRLLFLIYSVLFGGLALGLFVSILNLVLFSELHMTSLMIARFITVIILSNLITMVLIYPFLLSRFKIHKQIMCIFLINSCLILTAYLSFKSPIFFIAVFFLSQLLVIQSNLFINYFTDFADKHDFGLAMGSLSFVMQISMFVAGVTLSLLSFISLHNMMMAAFIACVMATIFFGLFILRHDDSSPKKE